MTETTGGDSAEGLEDLQRALSDRFFLGLVEQFRKQFDNVGSAEVEDAVAAAVEKLLKRLERGPVGSVRSYLAKSAFNELRKITTRRREIPVESHADLPTDGPDEKVLRQQAIELVKAEIRTWENANIKHVMLVYVDMIVAGDVLETDEVAEIVSQNLGEDINPLSVRTWKARGMRKLREFIEDAELSERRRAVGEKE
ncbi:hypothetical protein ACU610_21300 [Geodermatophilus sp. URMC 61]|uniref:hypothetical protein n=1 Tax=Geodermatophilus sp. URMC 61 TaxID=3423411 RepID=UPI00406C94D0